MGFKYLYINGIWNVNILNVEVFIQVKVMFSTFFLSGSTHRNRHLWPKDNKGERKSFILFVQPAVEILSGALLYNLNSVMMIISSSSC